MSSSDILRELQTQQIVELRDFYSVHRDEIPQVHSFLKTALKWRQTNPEYITIFGVGDDWLQDGTFIALFTFSCYDIFLFSCEDSGDKLFKGLTQTKCIKLRETSVLYYATHEKFRAIIYKAMKEINVPIDRASTTYLWQIMQKEALHLTSDSYQRKYGNEEFYMDSIKPQDAEVINEVWPPRYKGSLEYLRTFIQMNGGYGIYERNSGKLVSWALCNILGQVGVLQTSDGYNKKGFGSAVTAKLTQLIARNGDHPIGTVHDGNVPSERLFSNLGFQKKFCCNYIRTNPNQ